MRDASAAGLIVWNEQDDFSDIRYATTDDGIAKITINRPEVLNAFRPQTLIEVPEALTRAREDESVGVIVLTGAGDRAFCAGGDQRVRGDSGYQTSPGATGRFHVTDLHVQMRRCPKPIVAMVAGYAIGGGHVLHLVCDLTIAADNAVFGQVGPRVGSFDGGFGASSLADLVGMKKAKEIWFLCRQYDAAKALDMGLVNTVVPLADLEAETGLLGPRDARALAVRAASDEGKLPCCRGRLRRPPAAGARHQPAVLRDRRGPGGPRGLQGEAHPGLLGLPAPRLTPDHKTEDRAMTDAPDQVVTWQYESPGILVVSLDRRPANALGIPLLDGMHLAMDAAEAAGDVRVMLITSALDGFFAAGADIKHLATIDADSFLTYGDKMRAVNDRLAAAPWLSIAAVDGLALGGGLELAMAATLRVSGPAARFGLPEVKLGLIPGAGGTQRLTHLVGRGRALDIMLTARQVEPAEAFAIGLVDRLVDGDVVKGALELAHELAGSSLPAQIAVVRAVDAAADLTLADGIARERELEQGLFEHGEAAEGIAAFVAKRRPDFR